VDGKTIIKFFKKRSIAIAEVRRTRKRCQFVFCTLEDASDLDKACALSGVELQGRALSILKSHSRPRYKMVLIRNLPDEATEDQLRELFPGAQQVIIPVRDDGLRRGIAFLEFSKRSEVDNAVKTLQGSELGGMSLHLDYSGPKRKKEKFDHTFGEYNNRIPNKLIQCNTNLRKQISGFHQFLSPIFVQCSKYEVF
jgi:RNA recognition motif-containing protein